MWGGGCYLESRGKYSQQLIPAHFLQTTTHFFLTNIIESSIQQMNDQFFLYRTTIIMWIQNYKRFKASTIHSQGRTHQGSYLLCVLFLWGLSFLSILSTMMSMCSTMGACIPDIALGSRLWDSNTSCPYEYNHNTEITKLIHIPSL